MTGVMTLRNRRYLRASDVIQIIFILLGYLIPAHSHICEIGQEKDPQNEWKWMLPYADLCQCTSVIMGGMNTRTPIRPFVPRYYKNSLLSNDIHEIRNYYGLRCDKTQASTNAETLSTSSTLVTTQFRRRVSQVSTTTASEKKTIKESTTTEDSNSLSTLTQFRYRVRTTTTEMQGIDKTTREDVSSTIRNLPTISSQNATNTVVIAATKHSTSTNMTKGTTTDSKESRSSSTQQTTSRGTSTTRTITAREHVKSTPPEKTTTDFSTNADSTTQSWTGIPACNDYLGMEKGNIPDEHVTASSFTLGDDKYDLYPYKARLNGNSCWMADTGDKRPWIQADIGYQTNVTGIITQGDGNVGVEDWVKTLMVSTFFDSTDDIEVFIKDEDGDHKVFTANTDRNTAVKSIFPEPVVAQIVRITCLTAKRGDVKQMRFEILGCKKR